jgi:cytochrome c oxidase subunit 3
MSLSFSFGALLTAILVWLFIVRKFTAKPWDSRAAISAMDAHAEGTERTPPKKMGLWVFMGVMTSLFGLFISAYYIRMGDGHGADADLGDWEAISESPLLWFNTALLVLGSIAMQWSRSAAARGDAQRARATLLVGGILTICFLIGQLVVWRDLHRSEFFSLLNPAVAFFYVLTAVHGLHLIGGLYVWGRTYARMRYQRVELIDVRLSIELCSVYFHYLLLVWIVLFGLLLAT